MVIGDRLDTDIEGANNAQLPSLLVMTGVARTLDLWLAPLERRPDHVGGDLRALSRPALQADVDGDEARCADATAVIRGGRLTVTWTDDPVAGVVAGASLVWQQDGQPAGLAEEAERLDTAVRATASVAVD